MGGSWLRPTPKQFGNYSILDHIATGGMAEVYLARQGGMQGFEKIVVIKRAKPELMADQMLIQGFLDEARLVATLQHPNIAQVYEIGIEDDSYFFVMEYVQGVDLRQLMQRCVEVGRTISIGDAVYIAIQICIALHYAHEKRDRAGQPLDIIHRDVTPSNVLLSHDGAVKVCDFGIAKATNRTTETMRGAIKGKWSYMSPEQCRCEPLDRRSDIFAIGILLYEMSTLTPLFTGDTDFEILQKVAQAEVPPLSMRAQYYPRDLERLVMTALAPDRNARFPTAQAMQLELEAFARDNRLTMSPVNIGKLIGELFDEAITSSVNDRKAASVALMREGAQTREAGLRFLPVGTLTPPGGRPAGGRGVSDTEKVKQYDADTDLAIPLTARRLGADPIEAVTSPRLPPLVDPPARPPVQAPVAPTLPPGAPPQKTLRNPELEQAPRAPTADPAAPAPALDAPVPAPASARSHASIAAQPARRPSALWIVGAVFTGLAAVGVSLVGRRIAADSRAVALIKLDGDAQRIATQIEQVMQSTQLRARAIASAPVMRAAIETDAPTMRDVVDREYKLALGAHDTLEMLQVRGGVATSLLRVPPEASPITAQLGETARIEAHGRDALQVVIGEPIAQVGEVALAAPVELADAQRAIAEHVSSAKLAGLGAEIALVPGEGGDVAPERIALRKIGDVPAGSLVLVATPLIQTASWVGPATYIVACFAVLLLITYAMAWWLSRTVQDER